MSPAPPAAGGALHQLCAMRQASLVYVQSSILVLDLEAGYAWFWLYSKKQDVHLLLAVLEALPYKTYVDCTRILAELAVYNNVHHERCLEIALGSLIFENPTLQIVLAGFV